MELHLAGVHVRVSWQVERPNTRCGGTLRLSIERVQCQWDSGSRYFKPNRLRMQRARDCAVVRGCNLEKFVAPNENDQQELLRAYAAD